MKRSMLFGVIAAMAASCTVQEADVLLDEGTSPVYYATFEQPEEEDTKVYANEQLLIRWHEDDRLSIFNKLTYNQQYQFTGKTGDNSGGFRKVDGDEFVTGNTLNDIVAAYPYQQGTSIAEDEVLSVDLPAEQVYAQNSFGRGANAMVSVTSGNMLMFKNVGAYLMFSLYGENISVSSITLKGNNNEKLSGKAYVTMPLNGLPSTEVIGDATDASNAITLRCETPVALGASTEEFTAFWFVVPPVTFSRGFTITITQAGGGTVEKSTSRSVTLTRNKLSRMEPVLVEKAALPEPEAVDLGLPSGLKWACFNVGATKPEEYGDYFAWGETEPKSYYGWSTYTWCNGEYNKLTKYCTQSNYWGSTYPMDNKSVLDLEDDAAHVNWGGSWRMPTWAEYQELLDNCTWTWTIQNGVNGVRLFGPNGNSIFLPAAGFREGAVLYEVGSYGLYGLSSLIAESPCDAYLVAFWSNCCCSGNGNRFISGQSIRPVYGEFIPVTSVSLEASSLELKVGESYSLSATISPSNATEKTIHWSTSDKSVAVVDANGLVTALRAGTVTITAYGSSGVSAECTVTVEAVPLSAPDDVVAVDLGLPSGLKWASCNVGASKPEQYGAYFAWGETEPKSVYSWSTYMWCNGEDNKLTKYCNKSNYWYGSGSMDNKTVLDLSDDAARTNWGGSWRMPTLAECQELLDNCTWTWTSQNGVSGRMVTGPNGNSIFLPISGYRYDTNLYGVDFDGRFWSSSLYSYEPNGAYNVGFNSRDSYCGYNFRCNGIPVRPVFGEFIPVSSVSVEPSSLALKEGESYTLSATISPSNATEKTIHWVSSDKSVATVDAYGFVTAVGAVTATITAYGSSGVYATCEVTVKERETETITVDGYECVDLGLPSGLKWATCNVGATKPEEYGDYFAWGETEPYYETGYAQSESPVWKPGKESGYFWPSYKFELGTYDDGPFAKYVTNSNYGMVDNKTVLDLEDDAAHVNWGGSWRMPTFDEWIELSNNCTWTWTTQNGVKGYKVFSKTNGNSIFLLAAGYRNLTDLGNAGSYGYYWSSSLYTDYPVSAYGVYFDSDNFDDFHGARDYGFSVHPVSE